LHDVIDVSAVFFRGAALQVGVHSIFPHVGAIDDVDTTLFARLNQFVCVRQQQHPARSEIEIFRIQARLIEWSKVTSPGYRSICCAQFEHGITCINAT